MGPGSPEEDATTSGGYVAKHGGMANRDENNEVVSYGRTGAKNLAEAMLAEMMEGQGMLRASEAL